MSLFSQEVTVARRLIGGSFTFGELARSILKQSPRGYKDHMWFTSGPWYVVPNGPDFLLKPFGCGHRYRRSFLVRPDAAYENWVFEVIA